MSTRFQWTAKGDGTSWDDRKNWSPEDVPKEADIAVIGPVTPDKRLPAVRLRGDVVVDGLELKGDQASISGGTMTVRSEFRWEGGSVFTPLTVRGSMTVTGPFANSLRGRNGSTGITVHGSAVIDTTTLDFSEGATLTSLGSCRIVAPSVLRWRGGGVPPEFVSEGTLLVAGPPIVLARQTEPAAAAGPVAFGPVAAVVDGVRLVLRGQVEATAGALELASGHRHEVAASLNAVLEVRREASMRLAGPLRLGKDGRLRIAGGAVRGGGHAITGPGRVVWTEGDLYAPLTLGADTALDLPAGGAGRALRGGGVLTARGDVFAGDATGQVAALRVIEDGALVSDGTFRPSGDVRVSTGRELALSGLSVFRVSDRSSDRLTVAGPLRVDGTVEVTGHAIGGVGARGSVPSALPIVLAQSSRLTGTPTPKLPSGWEASAVLVADAGQKQVRVDKVRTMVVITDTDMVRKGRRRGVEEIARRLAASDGARLLDGRLGLQLVSSREALQQAVTDLPAGVDHVVLFLHGERDVIAVNGAQASMTHLSGWKWPALDTVTIRACNVARAPKSVYAFAKRIKARRVVSSNRFWIWRPHEIAADSSEQRVGTQLGHEAGFVMPGTGPLAGQARTRTVVTGWFTADKSRTVLPPAEKRKDEKREEDVATVVVTAANVDACEEYERADDPNPTPAGEARIYDFRPSP